MENEIPQLTDQFHKARKNLAFFSGLLLAWTLIGVNIGKKPFDNISFDFNNPDIIPIVISFLVVYFIIRLTIEWFQSSAERRLFRASKIDFGLALILSILSLAIFLVQEISIIQIAEKYRNYLLAIPWIILFLFPGYLIIAGLRALLFNKNIKHRYKYLLIILLYYILVYFYYTWKGFTDITGMLAALPIMIFLIVVMSIWGGQNRADRIKYMMSNPKDNPKDDPKDNNYPPK